MPAAAPPAPRPRTDWDRYAHVDPANPVVRRLFLDVMFRGYRELLSEARFSEPVSILELGAGTGYVSRRIAETLPTRQVTLVDANARMLEVAQETFAPVACEVTLIHGDFFTLPPRGAYDLVHSAGVVEHFERDRRATLLRLHAELVRPGGYCIVYAPTPSAAYRFWRRFLERVHLWPFSDEVPLLPEQLAQEVEAAGLQVRAANRFWPYFLTEAGVLAWRPEPDPGRGEGEV